MKRGRPPLDTEAVTLRLTREMIQAIDDRRRIEPDLPNRQDMIRRGMAAWLKMPPVDVTS